MEFNCDREEKVLLEGMSRTLSLSPGSLLRNVAGWEDDLRPEVSRKGQQQATERN